MHDVITIGSATLDVFLCCANLYTAEINGEKKVVLPYGAKIELGEALFESGGGGTNTAITFARHGLKTAVIAKIGIDFSGEKILRRLEEEHIDTHYMAQKKDDLTDYSTIIWAPKVGNVIIVCRGKKRLEVEDVDWNSIDTKWFYVSSVGGNLSIPARLEQFCRERKENTPKIAWNPGKRELAQRAVVSNLLPFVEVFILNRLEASMFTQTDIKDSAAILNAMQKLPAKMKIVTDGHSGSYLHNGSRWIWADTFDVDRQEVTGAGDAFGSAFVSGLIKGFSESDCMKLATANAASVVMTPGAKQGILRSDQVDEWMKKELEIREI